MRGRTQEAVKKALDKIERRLGARCFREAFKSITSDNGGEFLNQEWIEKSCINTKKKRTTLYYCHPYSAWERGSNENANKLIRRFIPKGADIADYSEAAIARIERYMNNYPRKLLDGYSPNDLYEKIT
jgi:IS30 family transposase